MSPFQRAESPNHRLPPQPLEDPRGRGRASAESEFRAICSSSAPAGFRNHRVSCLAPGCATHFERDEALAGERIITVSRWGGRRLAAPCALTRLPATHTPNLGTRPALLRRPDLSRPCMGGIFTLARCRHNAPDRPPGDYGTAHWLRKPCRSSSSLSGVGRLNQRPRFRASANRCCRRHRMKSASVPGSDSQRVTVLACEPSWDRQALVLRVQRLALVRPFATRATGGLLSSASGPSKMTPAGTQRCLV